MTEEELVDILWKLGESKFVLFVGDEYAKCYTNVTNEELVDLLLTFLEKDREKDIRHFKN